MAGGIRRVRRLVHLVVLVCIVVLVGLRISALMEERRSALEQARTSAADLARVVEEFARRTFGMAALTADIVAEGIARRGGVAAIAGSEEAHCWLAAMIDRPETGDYLVAVDADGVLIAASHVHPAPRTPLGDRSWFRAHQAGADRHVGEALVSRVTQEILFTYSRAIRRPDGSLEGVVQVATRLGFFEALTFATETAQNARLGLWTTDGRVIARTGLRPEEIEALRMPEGVAPDGTTPGATGILSSAGGPGGGVDLVAWRRLPDWPIVATVAVPTASALAPFRRSLLWNLALGTGVLLVLGGLTWLVQGFAAREERTLAELTAANAALRDARGALEARVAERTQALAEANRLMAEKEARFRGIFDSQFQFSGLLSPDGLVLEANQATLDFAGVPAEAVVGHPLWDAPWWRQADTASQARLRAAIAEAAAGGFVRFDVERRGADGRTITVDFSLKPVRDGAGRIAWLVSEGRDVTALKAAQAQLHEAQKLETLGQLTGGVAHDFNNLLMVVLGNLALIQKRLPDDPRLQRLLDGAMQGAQRGAALTQRLLAFARRQELRPEALDVAALVRGMGDLLRRSLGPGIRIRLDLPEGLPPIRADANQLEMALLNLALNARDAMPAGGTLVIEARSEGAPGVERPSGLTRGGGAGVGAGFLRLAVSDDGMGMDEATLRRATEPFFTTKGPGKGSGLGLSMVHGLAAQSGGRLAVRSRPDEGTTVELWLPVAEPAAEAPAEDGGSAALAAAAAPQPPLGPLAILLVDDDPLIQAGTAAMLEDLGHEVVVAGDGAAALAALSAPGRRFALMVTDFAMPGMNGVELATRARAIRPDLAIVLASGYADLPDGPERPGLVRLSKPYRQEELVAAIRRALGHGPRAAAEAEDAPFPAPVG